MLKILQARLQQYVNHELPNVQAGFRKGRVTRDQIANIRWIIEKAREFQKNIYFCFIHYTKAFDGVDHHKLWKILKEMGIQAHLTWLLRNLYAGQEATVRLPLEMSPGREAACRAVFGTWGFFPNDARKNCPDGEPPLYRNQLTKLSAVKKTCHICAVQYGGL